MKYALNLAILVALYVTGTLIFTGGFLLRRVVIQANSTCTGDAFSSAGYDQCTLSARHKRAVIIVIDALRYDFVTYNYSDNFEALPFQNKFHKLNEIIRERPENSKLYRFVADPPTTTLQRLKGLTTGSLPTFVDAGSNFAKTEISEDNFIDQLRSQNRTIIFTGDDTWMGLYPDRFRRSFPYPSFNVKDLHTVDDGVISHLVPELVNSEWDLLIGHLLGVDHCGHTFSPFHRAMGEKLEQMDNFIELVVQNLDNDTILFMMGDHGMTRTGDHGGDSSEEVEAALFVYSNRGLGSLMPEEDISVSQVDFVASISLTLGLPIPYQNLGIVIPELFRICQDGDCKGDAGILERELSLLRALHINANQVNRYLGAYEEASGSLGVVDAESFNAMFDDAESEYGKITSSSGVGILKWVVSVQAKYQRYLLSVRSYLRKKWAQFDMPSMFLGGLIFAIALLINLFFILTDYIFAFGRSSLIVALCFVVSLGLLLYGLSFLSIFSFLISLFVFVSLVVRKHFSLRKSIGSYFVSLNTKDILSVAIWLMYVTSLLSNSFIVYEGSVTSFLLQSCLYLQLICTVCDYFSSQWAAPNKNPKKVVFVGSVYLLVIITMAMNFLLDFSRSFQACREEQMNCTESWILGSSLLDDNSNLTDWKKKQFFLSLISIPVVFFGAYRWLRKNGNANGSSPSVFALKYSTFFSCLFVAAYWCLRNGPKLTLNQLSSLAPPVAKLVYLCVFISVVLVVLFPLCTYVIKHLPGTAKENLNSAINNILLSSASSQHFVPQIFRHLRTNWAFKQNLSQPEEDEPKVFVYGLATIFSSPLIILLLNFTALLAMLLDFSVALSLFIACVVLFLVLELHSLSFNLKTRHVLGCVPTSSIVLFLLLSSERFYSLGHHPTITSIRWEAAYHGFEGDFHSNFIPAVLIGLNTFASQVLIFLAVPLLMYWPFTRGTSLSSDGKHNPPMANSNSTSSSRRDDIKGEFSICEEDKRGEMSQLCLKTLLFCALKLFGMMICVMIHRRHLMVWKIFAPRFIYEVVAFFIASAICMFNYLFFLRTYRAVDKFISSLK